MIGVIDYQAGNLQSVIKALNHINVPCRLIQRLEDTHDIERLILPGVGAFQSAIDNLHAQDLFDFVARWLELSRPFLGICLGLQILCKGSEESQGAQGFDRIPVSVQQFKNGKVPQIGWNQVAGTRSSRLLRNIRDDSFFYFLHSYYVPSDTAATVGTTEYGVTYTSVIEQDAMCAVQFHPEKSGEAGLQLLKNWVTQC